MREGNICPNCFQETPESGTCRQCGFDRREEKKNPLGLPEFYRLEGRYLLGRTLGFGGFGITYKAFDLMNRCCCAVKEFVPAGVSARDTDGIGLHAVSNSRMQEFEHGKKRFLEEAEVLKKLTDIPEVVQITDYFAGNNTVYFVMEYLEGATLKQLMEACGGKIPYSQAVSVIRLVGEALEKVHTRTGIFHRDISPDNIMVTKNGRVKLIDFGNAKYMIGKNSQNLSVVLKHGYAPPEQYSSTGSQGSYTDVYALAATFYYAVSGVKIPGAPDRFGGETYRPLSEIVPAAGAKASTAVDLALELNSKKRTQSAAGFVRALSGESVSRKTKTPYIKLAGNSSKIWRLPENVIVSIGRSPQLSDIVPTTNGMVSKKHCELFFDSMEECFYLEDQSTNGTWVGNRKLVRGEAYVLGNGEIFSLGNHICDLEVGWNNG